MGVWHQILTQYVSGNEAYSELAWYQLLTIATSLNRRRFGKDFHHGEVGSEEYDANVELALYLVDYIKEQRAKFKVDKGVVNLLLKHKQYFTLVLYLNKMDKRSSVSYNILVFRRAFSTIMGKKELKELGFDNPTVDMTVCFYQFKALCRKLGKHPNAVKVNTVMSKWMEYYPETTANRMSRLSQYMPQFIEALTNEYLCTVP